MPTKPHPERLLFRSYQDLHNDIQRWLPALPEFSAVSGVPRSGIIPAMVISMLRHIPFIPVESILNNTGGYRTGCSRQLESIDGPVLLVDDTCWAGRTFSELRSNSLPPNVVTAAVYTSAAGRSSGVLDYAGYNLSTPHHTFSWNLLKDVICRHLMVDMDGVLCEDWGKPDEGDWESRYHEFLLDAKPLVIPHRAVAGVVTARLAKYRKQTEDWLRAYGVQYTELHLCPAATPKQRAQMDGFIGHKSQVFANSKALGFVESDLHQAQGIAERTGKTVIHLESGTHFNSIHPEFIHWRRAV